MRVISTASSNVGAGRMPGSLRASIVLPAPGGPIIRRLWPPAAAISSARGASGCPRTSERSGPPAEGRHSGPGAAPPLGPGVRWISPPAVVDDLDEFAEARHAQDLDVVDEDRLGSVLGWD